MEQEYKTFTQKFGLLVENKRATYGLSLSDLAAKSGLARKTISNIEKGVSQRMHGKTNDALIKALHIMPEEEQAIRDGDYAELCRIFNGIVTLRVPLTITAATRFAENASRRDLNLSEYLAHLMTLDN